MNTTLDLNKSRYMAQDWANKAGCSEDYCLYIHLIGEPSIRVGKRNEDLILFDWMEDTSSYFQLAFTLNDMNYLTMNANSYYKYKTHDQRSLKEKAIEITKEEFMDKYDEVCEKHGVQKIW